MRIGVFICHCGINIAGKVDIDQARAAAAKLPGVVHVADLKYSCSLTGQTAIKKAIPDEKLDRILVASCSPRMHEVTFSRCIAAAGLNPYLLEMVNIREQASWVHEDPRQATRKAIALIRMGVAKLRNLEPLFPSKSPVAKRALVIGGGISGIQAALYISQAGYPVTLVERSPSIGGRMAQLEKTFPTLDCSA